MRAMLSRSIEMVVLLLPTLAYAHGDDDVTMASFLGPIVALLVFGTLVGLGRVLLRTIIRRA